LGKKQLSQKTNAMHAVSGNTAASREVQVSCRGIHGWWKTELGYWYTDW